MVFKNRNRSRSLNNTRIDRIERIFFRGMQSITNAPDAWDQSSFVKYFRAGTRVERHVNFIPAKRAVNRDSFCITSNRRATDRMIYKLIYVHSMHLVNSVENDGRVKKIILREFYDINIKHPIHRSPVFTKTSIQFTKKKKKQKRVAKMQVTDSLEVSTPSKISPTRLSTPYLSYPLLPFR